MSKHTPGPLFAHGRAVMTAAAVLEGRVLAYTQDNPKGSAELDESYANARMFAAAPELFDALNDLFRAIEGEPAQLYRADAEFHGACSAALRKALAALTKAVPNEG